MKRIVFDECPYCHSNMLVYGYQTDNGQVFSDIRGGVFGTQIQHTICRECGSIIYSRVIKPDILKEFVDPENKAKFEEMQLSKPKKKKEGILEIIVDE